MGRGARATSLWAALALSFLLFAGSACSGGEGTRQGGDAQQADGSQERSAPAEQTAQEAAPQKDLAVGESAELENGLVVAVTGVRRSEGNLNATDSDDAILEPEETFVIADVTVENTGEQTIPVDSGTNFAAYDYDGYQLVPATPEETFDEKNWEGDFRPGQERSGTVSYFAPEDATVLLTFNGDGTTGPPTGNNTATWDLGPVAEMPNGVGTGETTSSPRMETTMREETTAGDLGVTPPPAETYETVPSPAPRHRPPSRITRSSTPAPACWTA